MASPPTRVAKFFFSTRQQPHPPFFRNTFSQINLFIRGVHACGECVRLWPVTKALHPHRAKKPPWPYTRRGVLANRGAMQAADSKLGNASLQANSAPEFAIRRPLHRQAPATASPSTPPCGLPYFWQRPLAGTTTPLQGWVCQPPRCYHFRELVGSFLGGAR